MFMCLCKGIRRCENHMKKNSQHHLLRRLNQVKPDPFIESNLIDSNEIKKYTDENILSYNSIICSCLSSCIML